MKNITYYKKSEYDYSKDFWGKNQKREYEDLADKNAVGKNLPKKMDWLVDIGGGYGRLVPIYKKYSKNIIIADLSLDLLKEAQKNWGKNKNIYFIRINACHLPFKNSSIKYGISYRLMHHITDQKRFFKELDRVFTTYYFLEFPNKRHFFQILKYIFLGKRDIHIFSDKPEVRDGMFLNYSPKYIEKIIVNNTGFKIKDRIGVSYYRRFFKKIFSIDFLMFFENIWQKIPILSWMAPSNVFILSKDDIDNSTKSNDIKDLLVCPKCHQNLDWKNCKCTNCNQKFKNKNGIIDFVLDKVK